METLDLIWAYALTALGGISMTGILAAIIYGCLKGAFSKTVSKIDVEKIANKATEKGIERVKKVSFTHNIQPLVESELSKINEKSVEVLKDSLKEVNDNYNKIINILEGLAMYFDNSIGVSEEKKAALKEIIANAKKEPITAESVVSDEIIIEDEKKSAEAKKEPKKSIAVER